MERLQQIAKHMEDTLKIAEINNIQLADKETVEKIIEKIKGIK